MTPETTEKKSVSFPASLLAKAQETSAVEGRSFSSFVSACICEELKRRGLWPESESSDAEDEYKATLEVVGPERMRDILRDARAAVIEEVGA